MDKGYKHRNGNERGVILAEHRCDPAFTKLREKRQKKSEAA